MIYGYAWVSTGNLGDPFDAAVKERNIRHSTDGLARTSLTKETG